MKKKFKRLKRKTFIFLIVLMGLTLSAYHAFPSKVAEILNEPRAESRIEVAGEAVGRDKPFENDIRFGEKIGHFPPGVKIAMPSFTADYAGASLFKRVDERSKGQSAGDLVEGKVTKVIDGDTLEVTLGEGEKLRVRLIGINTPETVHPNKPIEFYGKEASDFSKAFLFQKTVYLEKDLTDRDIYGHALRYLWLSVPREISESEIKAKLYNAILLTAGFAAQASYEPDVKYKIYFERFEKEARDLGLGLWNKKEEEAFNQSLSKGLPSNKESSSPEELQKSDYVANSNTMKFHLPECRHVKNIKVNNRVAYYATIMELLAYGYSPCKVCLPVSPMDLKAEESAAALLALPEKASKTNYMANTNTMKFHFLHCQYVPATKAENQKEYYATRDELIGYGFAPCKVCRP